MFLLKTELETAAAGLQISGLIITACEGANGTVAGTPDNIEKFKKKLSLTLQSNEIKFKDSWAFKNPFRRFKVKTRQEIVSIGSTELFPELTHNHHLSPTEWNEVLEKEDVLLVDTRNKYETELGVFQGAIDPNINTFQEFPEYIQKANFPKDKKILMYCTGGIRCEKAILEMQRQGYENVYQLEGGILKYLEQYPDHHYKGECFVFDHRVSVDQKLEPSKEYFLCAHCGNPGKEIYECGNCGQLSKICKNCSQNAELKTCSKNCAYHFELKLAKNQIASQL